MFLNEPAYRSDWSRFCAGISLDCGLRIDNSGANNLKKIPNGEKARKGLNNKLKHVAEGFLI